MLIRGLGFVSNTRFMQVCSGEQGSGRDCRSSIGKELQTVLVLSNVLIQEFDEEQREMTSKQVLTHSGAYLRK